MLEETPDDMGTAGAKANFATDDTSDDDVVNDDDDDDNNDNDDDDDDNNSEEDDGDEVGAATVTFANFVAGRAVVARVDVGAAWIVTVDATD